MHCNQNEKINQVKDSTLVVGIDIGSTTHYARAFDWRGLELGKIFKFSNSLEGFQSLKEWMGMMSDSLSMPSNFTCTVSSALDAVKYPSFTKTPCNAGNCSFFCTTRTTVRIT